MTEKRNITKEDVLLKARIGGAQVEVTEPPRQATSGFMVLDGCDVRIRLPLPGEGQWMENLRQIPKPPLRHSPAGLKAVIDDSRVTIVETDEVIATGKLEPRAFWRDKRIGDGRTVDDVIMCTDDCQSNILLGNRCYTSDSGEACKFCSFGPQMGTSGPVMDRDETLRAAEPAIEATVIAIKNGWRGFLNLAGGTTLPERRGQWTTDILQAIMARFHKSLDEDILSQLQIAVQVYPPPDLAALVEWKSFGINSVEFDNQVMDLAYFKAICPGRGEKKRWHEAQEAGRGIRSRPRFCKQRYTGP